MTNEEMTVTTLRQLLRVQGELRDLAEDRWKRAQRSLVSLLETFAPEELDRRLKNAEPLDNLEVDDLMWLTIQGINTRLNQKRVQQDHDTYPSGIQTVRDEIQNKQNAIEKLRTENRRLGEEIQILQKEIDGYQNQLAAHQQISEKKADKLLPHLGEDPQSEDAPEPDWMVAWRKLETFERDTTVLRLLGETGLARRPQVELRLSILEPGGSFQDSFSRLENLDLIELFRPINAGGTTTGDPSSDLTRLAKLGRFAYMLLTGASPVLNEYEALLARQIPPKHNQLYLQAADLLREANYQVNLSPPDIHLPNDCLFKADLLAIDRKSQTIYITVEMYANQNREERLDEWRGALQANGGQIFIFCDDLACMRMVRSEINFHLGREAVQSYLTNVSDLQSGKRATDGGIWLDARTNHVPSVE